MKLDLMNQLDPKRALSPVATAAADNVALITTILDMQGCRAAVLLILTGTLADGDATFTVTMVHGDQANLSDSVAVAAADLVGTLALASFTFTADDGVRKVGYRGQRRFIRATITPLLNAAAAPIAAVWVRGELEDQPAPNPPV